MDLDDLIRDNKPIYVRNRTKPKGSIALTIFGENSRPIPLEIPNTWIPICVSATIPLKFLANSTDFRRMLDKGLIELVDPKTAKEIMGMEDARIEYERLHVSQFSEKLGPEMAEVKEKLKEMSDYSQEIMDDGIQPIVKDVLLRDIPDREKISILKNYEDSLTTKDKQYLIATGSPSIKNWVSKLA